MGNPFDKPHKTGGVETPDGGTVAVSSDPFALPPVAGGGDYKFTDFLGELLLVRPTAEDVMQTKISPETEVIVADVVRLDNDNEQIDDMLVFQSALIRALRKVLRGPNAWVLGRLEKGEAKNGKSAPYILSLPDTEDTAKAREAMKQLGLM